MTPIIVFGRGTLRDSKKANKKTSHAFKSVLETVQEKNTVCCYSTSKCATAAALESHGGVGRASRAPLRAKWDWGELIIHSVCLGAQKVCSLSNKRVS